MKMRGIERMNIMMVVIVVQAFFAVIMGMYFWNLLRNQRTNKTVIDRESRKELEKLQKLRDVQLSQPLSEWTRPATMNDLIGQQDGIKALKAALCGPNPQHVIIYGPPGVGKTAAARVILEEAKKNPRSPFGFHSQFTEIDATTARFDERGIADPLIGSVHDPIYQGAGAMGVAGIPQPKPGAVTKAHGGILFIDEIGELHPVQMNKLLKVLEDRKVFLESSYYSSEDPNIPSYIHDIFQNGLPADFRLVGATTRTPQEIPPAIRSRCMEVYFRPLFPEEIESIVIGAMRKIGMKAHADAVHVAKKYASNGREAVNMIQMAAGMAMTDHRDELIAEDIEWVVNSRQMSPRYEPKIHTNPTVGLVNGLAVHGPNLGHLIEIEVTTAPCNNKESGTFNITGIVEEEEMGGSGKTIRRKSMAKSSIENVITVLRRAGLRPEKHDIHINFPGGIPMDGPSAGITIAIGIASSICQIAVDNAVAMTGELSIHGKVKPVGGIVAKVEAALQAGVRRVLIPEDNWQEMFSHMEGIEVVPVKRIEQVLECVLGLAPNDESRMHSNVNKSAVRANLPILHADGLANEQS